MRSAVRQYSVVYCSPSGTTRRVAATIADTLKELELQVAQLDLGASPNPSDFILNRSSTAQRPVCLFIGSPVYASHAIAPVMNFIADLPDMTGSFAVPFVTWGGATSGIALYEMGDALHQKGMLLLGAAKVIARHSLMWSSDKPLGDGHPNAEDLDLVQNLVVKAAGQVEKNQTRAIGPSDLIYWPENVVEEMQQRTFDKVKPLMPKRQVIGDRCNQCGLCLTNCPMAAIALMPYPAFNSDCIYCYNCVRLCPERAIVADLKMLHEHIIQRSEAFNERPYSKIFFR